jgi:nucleoside-diphosphate-sugar epimerase
VTAEYAIANNDVVAAYLASKTLAERAVWAFITSNKPDFDVTVLNPYVMMGPMLHVVQKPEDIPSTNAFPIWNFLNGTYQSIDGLVFPAWYFVDVRDVARAHVLSLTNPRASNKRIILSSGLMTPQSVINIIHKNFPQLKGRVIEGNADKLMPDGVEPTEWDTSRSCKVFGEKWEYTGLEKTVVDAVQNFLVLEKEWQV